MPYHAIRDPSRLHALLDAVLLVESDFSLPVVLRRIVETATSLVDARYGALGVLDEAGTGLAQFHTVGAPEGMAGAIGHQPEGKGILGLLIREPKPIRLADLTTHPAALGFPPGHVPMHSFLGVPVTVAGQPHGNLYLTEKRSAPGFSLADEQTVVGLAVAAGIAVQNARVHARLSELDVLEDRERIARDLHDTVIQRLFAAGLGLQAVAPLVVMPEVAQRLQTTVDDLDETIRQIRTTIFALNARHVGSGLRAKVVALVGEVAPALGFVPTVGFDGPVEAVVPDELVPHVLAVLREAVTNVARHSRATGAEVSLRAGDGHLVLEVVDNGVGIPPVVAGTGRGLPNMTSRANELGGELALRPREEGGTELTWRVPLGDGRERAGGQPASSPAGEVPERLV